MRPIPDEPPAETAGAARGHRGVYILIADVIYRVYVGVKSSQVKYVVCCATLITKTWYCRVYWAPTNKRAHVMRVILHALCMLCGASREACDARHVVKMDSF